MILKCSKLVDDALIPTRKHENDAGVDFYSTERVTIAGNCVEIVKTGITVEVPHNCFMLIKPKSRSNFLVGAGVVDEGYQGEILVKIFNPTVREIIINKGDAIAQGLIIPIFYPKVCEVSLEKIHGEKSERGATGGILINKEES